MFHSRRVHMNHYILCVDDDVKHYASRDPKGTRLSASLSFISP